MQCGINYLTITHLSHTCFFHSPLVVGSPETDLNIPWKQQTERGSQETLREQENVSTISMNEQNA